MFGCQFLNNTNRKELDIKYGRVFLGGGAVSKTGAWRGPQSCGAGVLVSFLGKERERRLLQRTQNPQQSRSVVLDPSKEGCVFQKVLPWPWAAWG